MNPPPCYTSQQSRRFQALVDLVCLNFLITISLKSMWRIDFSAKQAETH